MSTTTTLSTAEERLATVQELINYEIYLREANQGKMTAEEFMSLQNELMQIGDTEEARDFNWTGIQKKMRELEALRIANDPSYMDWIIADQMADPADY